MEPIDFLRNRRRASRRSIGGALVLLRRWRTRMAMAVAMIGGSLFLADCAETALVAHVAKQLAGTTAADKPRGVYKVGDRYEIGGVWYQPVEDFGYDQTGIASWYGPAFNHGITANGERFDEDALTAAHPTLGMPSLVRVTNLENGRSVVVRVNDRGPFVRGRIIDVSRQTARLLDFESRGTAKVRVTVLGPESRRLKQETLARIGGRQVAQAEPISVIPAAMPPPPVAPLGALDEQRRQVIRQQPVGASPIYVQAGAFSNYENAERLRESLRHLGAIAITPVAVEGRRFYRVRLGPVTAVARADELLDKVISAGYPRAGIVVEGG